MEASAQMKNSKNKAMYDRIRARKARGMKRIERRSAASSSPVVNNSSGIAAAATSDAGQGARGGCLDPTVAIYLTLLLGLFFLPFWVSLVTGIWNLLFGGGA